jgi:hypothetical protein
LQVKDDVDVAQITVTESSLTKPVMVKVPPLIGTWTEGWPATAAPPKLIHITTPELFWKKKYCRGVVEAASTV